MKKNHFSFLKKIYPFLLVIPFAILTLLFFVKTLSADIIIYPENSPFPNGVKYVDDQIIVKYREGNSPEDLLKNGKVEKEKTLREELRSLGVKSQKKLFNSVDSFLKNYYLLFLEDKINIPNLYKNLLKIHEVDSVTPDYILSTEPSIQQEEIKETISKANGIPNDPYYLNGQQWDMESIQMENAWNIEISKSSLVVGVVDTGVDYNHPDLIGKIIKGKNYINNSDDPMDDHGHGTHVAGTIAATTNNGIGIASVSWGGKILAVKACDNKGDCATSNVVRGIDYLLSRGVKIINISIAGIGSCGKENFFSSDRVYNDVIKEAQAKNALLIVAAGNHNKSATTEVPGACDGVFTIGATNQEKQRWFNSDNSGSNFGGNVRLSAPGSPILSTNINNSYSIRNGTSMATPHVSGVAALLLSLNSKLLPHDIIECLTTSGDELNTDLPIGRFLNAYEALLKCKGSNDITSNLISKLNISPTPASVLNNNSFYISGTVGIDENGNGSLEAEDRPLPNAQVILSPSENFESVLTNELGYYLFRSLKEGTYLISLSIPGVNSINLPTRTVTLTKENTSAIVNLPVLRDILPSPTTTQHVSGVTPTPTITQGNIDVGCLSGKKSVQICTFQIR